MTHSPHGASPDALPDAPGAAPTLPTSMLYALGAVLALLLFGYLFVALLLPERFL